MAEPPASRTALRAAVLCVLLGGASLAQVTEVPTLNPGVGGNAGAAGASLQAAGPGLGTPSLSLSAPALNGTLLPPAASPKPVLQPGMPVQAALGPAAAPAVQTAGLAAVQNAPAAAQPVVAPAAPGGPIGAPHIAPGTAGSGTVPAVGSKEFQQGLRDTSERTGELQSGLEEGQGGSPRSGEALSSVGSSVFEGAGRTAPGASYAPGAAGSGIAPAGLMGTVDVFSRAALVAAPGPSTFKSFAAGVLKGLKDPRANAALKARGAAHSGRVADIVRAQQAFNSRLKDASEAVLRKEGVPAGEVITHGTDLQGLLGMLFSGKIEATNPYAGFSGESAEVWGAKGLGAGAEYGAKRGVYNGRPGVSVLIHNPSSPIQVRGGETLSRAPAAAEDFLAAVVTDGESTLVLDRPALRALAASARAWKDSAVAAARQGRMREFSEWEKLRDYLEPSARR